MILFTAACEGACPAAVEEAIRRRGSMKDDDITAVAIKLIENEE